jgi:hypothetical protein
MVAMVMMVTRREGRGREEHDSSQQQSFFHGHNHNPGARNGAVSRSYFWGIAIPKEPSRL